MTAPVRTRAVFFDVDFTLIYPGPRFQASGYHEFCARHGIEVDPALFDRAVAGAASGLDTRDDLYDAQLYVDYTRRIIEGMGGRGAAVETVAREIYDEWAACSHFTMYDDVPDVLRSLHASGVKLGLISNSHRCLASFEAHFELRGLFAVTVSSIEHGYMKPHRSIFEAALSGADVSASESIMVGDSLTHDVDGARRLGMRGVLVARSGPIAAPPDVPVIQSLRELPALL
ncbi:MAG: HAD family hydrolase [Acidobacteria bacterium]|jgi:putative hydrolase of the HAD superfamily|nr:HAD family hydrolase [Acidobacteriota bacterium]